MSKYVIDESTLKGIADSIRSKKGTTAKIAPENMPTEIAGITAGENLDAELAEQEALIEELKAVLEEKVSGGAEPVIEPLEVTENGTYTAPDGVDGYSPVTVNVPTGGLDKLIDGTITEVSSAVTSIRDYAFYGHNNLASADFPNVTHIGDYAFYKCNKLASVDFPSATHIGEYAISDCGRFISADFPNVTSIGAYSFYRCYNLASVDFPKLVSVTMNSFNSTYSLKTIILRRSTMCGLTHTNAFNGCYHLHGTKNSTYNPNGDKDCYIYVPRDLVDSYKSGSNWSTFSSQFRAIEDYPEITGG